MAGPGNVHLLLVRSTWADVLGELPASDDASFLLSGGDSLLATRMAVRLGQALGFLVPIRTVLENPSPRALAVALAELRWDPTATPVAAGQSRCKPANCLSFAQERMWFMRAIAPRSIAYNISQTLRLRGRLNVTVLRTALGLLVERHAVLRSNYINKAGSVFEVIRPHQAPVITESHLPATENPNEANRRLGDHLSRAVNRAFDLAIDPLLRLELVHVAKNDALLLIQVHHIISDQWSFDVLSRELADFYNSLVAGQKTALAELPLEYGQYAAWHREWFRNEREATELSYWLHQLDGLEPVTFTPDFQRPPEQSFRGARLRLDFDPQLAQALRQLGVESGATLAVVMLAALKALLHRHAGTTDVGIGLPIANRHHSGSETLVGTLLNTLVLRTDLGGDPCFQELIERVREHCLDAYEHQDMPFEQLVQELKLPRDPSRAPLFGVMFNMLNTPLGKLEFKDLKWSRFEFDRRAAQFDLTVTVDADYDRSIVFEYATDLYAPSTMERIAQQYMALLASIVELPETRLSSLPINSPDDQARLEAWGAGPERPLEYETLPALLASSFSAHSGRVALVCGTESLDYETLENEVESLARTLRARGIGRGRKVGLCLHRSTRMLIAPLAVMRAGGAWVPLDPAYPADRLAYMAGHAELDLLITESSLAARVPWQTEQTLLIDQPSALGDLGDASPWDYGQDAGPSDPAYIIYTSGSTGRPKGVVVPQRAVCNFLSSMGREPGIRPDDRLLAVTTLSFDISVLELLLPLTAGAQVVMAEQAATSDGHHLRRLILTHYVTLMQATPSTWRMLIEAGWRGGDDFRALVGGEPLGQELATDLLARSAEVWNMYGPTETTIWSTCWRVGEQALKGEISLGRPIDNTQVYVLDGYGQPCPIGAIGELHIGGAGLATGYYGRPALDVQQFIPDPFSNSTDARLYRTGDRARWRENGHLEHLGRVDFQVKVRGHRIELGEIEARLSQHPDLAGSVVIAREERPGDVRLVAYSVPWDIMPEPADLRAFLREKLPEHMVPQHFVELDAIPVLPNGKVDRAGLPAAAAHLVGSDRTHTPRDVLELRIWRLWRDVLGIDGFGIDDNFFDLGGHSMLAVRLVGKIREELGVEISVPRLFQYPTIKAFTATLQKPDDNSDGVLVPLQSEGDLAPLFCLCGIHLYQALANEFAPLRPVYSLFIPEEMSSAVQARSAPSRPIDVPALAARYLQVIRQHQPSGPYHLLGLSFGGILAFEIAQQLREQGDELALLAILDSNLPGRARQGLFFKIRRNLRKLLTRLRARSVTGTELPKFPPADARSNSSNRDDGFLSAIGNYPAKPYSGKALFIEALLAGEYTSFGWSGLVSELDLQVIQADHLGLLRDPAVKIVAETLMRAMDSSAIPPD